MDEDIAYSIFPSTKYKRTRKLAKKQGLDMDLLDWAIDQLARDIPLPANWRDHQLRGEGYAGIYKYCIAFHKKSCVVAMAACGRS